VYLDASAAATRRQAELVPLKKRLQATTAKIEGYQAERGRIFVGVLREVDARFRDIFRALCEHGDCSLEYPLQPAALFAEGISVLAKPPRSEWTRFEQLSGGQKALVAVALQLALQTPGSQHTVLFDEIDAALDSRRTQALAAYIRAQSFQSIFISHRPQMLDVSRQLIGTYSLCGASQSAALAFEPSSLPLAAI